MEKHLFQNLFVSNSAVDILDFLADHELTPRSFEKNWVLTHLDNRDLFLIFFIKKEKDEFISFRFNDFSQYPESMEYLNEILNGWVQSDYFTYKPIQQKLEHMIHMRPVFEAFHKAPSP
ncbi:hypothetical protein LAG90_08415 [Marinilongibacter aquaticus]|uniref:hypothetical protein n=1 Tax=Marinilongibacter aquaticus TaxID=2975157 RepID=UPI0021BD6689|nr:hypothetical protein [Marinilongibacter aquaticus]UBM60663.1 hypothetical protein LAG90_08415 [Marinilongibacter aquaticus]